MRTHRSVFVPIQVASLGVTMAAALAVAVLMFTTDPTPREERIFAIFVMFGAGGLGTVLMLMLSSRAGSPAMDAARAVRRGTLLGLAAAGAVFLQFNASLRPANLAFILLVLLIVEMIFLARRQHPS